MGEGHEFYVFGPYKFDIDKAKEIVKESPREVHDLPVADWVKPHLLDMSDEERKRRLEETGHGSFPRLRGPVDEEWARTKADLSIPVIIGDAAKKGEKPGGYFLMDGFHRLRRAAIEGREEIPAYVLTPEETRAIRSRLR